MSIDVDLAEMQVRARLAPALAEAVTAKTQEAAEQQVAGRLRRCDETLWGPPGAPEIADRLGWVTIAARTLTQAPQLSSFAAEIVGEGIESVVLLGMGGSSLAAEVIRLAFGPAPGDPVLHVLDCTDAARIAEVENAIDPRRTLFLVSSKSGGTIEPLSLFAHFWETVRDGASFVAITDPGSGLEDLAGERRFRRTFHGDPDIGGRYSALSDFGMVPAALMGVDIQAVLSGAGTSSETTFQATQDPDGEIAVDEGSEAGVWLGAALSALAQKGRDKLTFIVGGDLAGMGLWLEQLFAESTGKHGTGILPVADEPLGEVAEYGDDRVFVHLPQSGRDDDEQALARLGELSAAGHPVITVPTSGPEDLGRVFSLAETAVAVAGWGLAINPFDQPNVQQAKDATNEVLAGFRSDHRLPDVEDADDRELRSLLTGDGAGPPHYAAIMAYVTPSVAFDEAITELRLAIRRATRMTTTFGYGPRFLHSTGQFHKGGPKVGRFLQLIHDGPERVEIPGQPYDFTTLKNAQAIGDLHTLRDLGLPAQRVRLEGEDPVAGARKLTERIARILDAATT